MAAPDPLRIGYVLAQFPSATETFVANEIRGLTERGASVTVFALRCGQVDNVPDCPVVYREASLVRRTAGWWRAGWRAAREAVRIELASPSSLFHALRNSGTAARFARLVEQAGIRHLHAHFAFVPTDVALMIAQLVPVSVSFSAHAWDIYCRGRTLRRKVERASLCVTCTDAARRDVSMLAAGGDREKIVRIYHGTDLSRFAFRPRPTPAGPPLVLAVGRLVPKKGFETLLRACWRLREKSPLRCEIVGRGPLEGRLKALARNLELADSVTFSGALPYARMAETYRRADLLAAPSVIAPDGDRDGLPNVVTEAMACGVPVVGSRLSGIPEAVEDGRTGLLCSPGDTEALCEAIGRMIADTSLRSRCVQAARRLVEQKFDARRNAGQLLDVIRSVAELRD